MALDKTTLLTLWISSFYSIFGIWDSAKCARYNNHYWRCLYFRQMQRPTEMQEK